MKKSFARQLHEMYEHAGKYGGVLTIDVNGKEVGISVPKGSSVATVDKLMCDAVDRLDRILDNGDIPERV